jgi:predicted dithiol-disulfide oxidoreductase (DUF899 family)
MSAPTIGTREEWTAARLDLLKQERELTHLRDRLAEQRRALPWVAVEKDYRFEGPDGEVSLADLFAGQSQLIVYHFMFGSDWDEGCPSCSFWADSFDGTGVHLAHRDVSLVCVSRAPYSKLAAYRARMGWSFSWFSSAGSDFNFDFHVSFTPEQQANGAEYNFVEHEHVIDELHGVSAFARRDDGAVFHTYSTYARGLDPINSAYQLLDLTAKGRDEAELDWPMAWLRRHDAYE